MGEQFRKAAAARHSRPPPLGSPKILWGLPPGYSPTPSLKRFTIPDTFHSPSPAAARTGLERRAGKTRTRAPKRKLGPTWWQLPHTREKPERGVGTRGPQWTGLRDAGTQDSPDFTPSQCTIIEFPCLSSLQLPQQASQPGHAALRTGGHRAPRALQRLLLSHPPTTNSWHPQVTHHHGVKPARVCKQAGNLQSTDITKEF